MNSITPCQPHFLNRNTLEIRDKKVDGLKIASSWGLIKVADKENIFICPSTKDLWSVSKDGGLVRVSKEIVDNGESMPAAPSNSPSDFLTAALENLEF